MYYESRWFTPVTVFTAYQDLRAHLRIFHGVRRLELEEIWLYKIFPGAHEAAPMSLRVQRGARPIRSSSRASSRASSAQTSRNTSPNRQAVADSQSVPAPAAS